MRWAAARQLYLVTWGSSSCPKLPTKVAADGAHHLVIRTKAYLAKGDNACTADLGPTTSTVTLPPESDDAAELRVDVDDTALTLPPR